MNKKKSTRGCILYFRERRERAKLETIAPTGRCCRYAMVDWVRVTSCYEVMHLLVFTDQYRESCGSITPM